MNPSMSICNDVNIRMKEGAKFAQAAKTFKHSEVKSINFRTLRVLRNTMLLNFLHSRKFLGCQLGELFRTGLARRQQSCHHVSSLFRYDVTMSLGHFHNQAVCSQQFEAPSHRRHLLTLLWPIFPGRVKVSANIAVAKAVEQKFPTVNDGHQLGIAIPQWIERSVALTVVLNGPTHPSGLFFKRGLHMDGSQRRQMP